jgi:hypothetical protein
MGGFFCCYNRRAIRRDESMSHGLVYPSGVGASLDYIVVPWILAWCSQCSTVFGGRSLGASSDYLGRGNSLGLEATDRSGYIIRPVSEGKGLSLCKSRNNWRIGVFFFSLPFFKYPIFYVDYLYDVCSSMVLCLGELVRAIGFLVW